MSVLVASYTAAEIISFITVTGVTITGVIVAFQNKTIRKVEKQGNSRALESTRLIAMMARRVANMSGDTGDAQIAADAEKIYQAARESAENAQ